VTIKPRNIIYDRSGIVPDIRLRPDRPDGPIAYQLDNGTTLVVRDSKGYWRRFENGFEMRIDGESRAAALKTQAPDSIFQMVVP
jgi:hypothetical protein